MATLQSMLLVSAIMMLPACDLNVAVDGSVRAADGSPVHDVAVALQMPGRPSHVVHTARDGTFDVGMVGADPGVAKVLFEKPGFKSVERNLEGKARSTVHVVLYPDVTK